MQKFIGRKEELEALEVSYKKNCFQMFVIYGRRRVGKSTLIKEFIKNKKAVYFTAIKNGLQKNISLWSNIILENLIPEISGISLNSMEAILSFLDSKCKNQRIVVVIDELPYLAENDKSFISLLQNYIDNNFLSGQMMLILCGSSISFMEDEVLHEKSPLFGRRSGQIRLEPFSYIESALFTPSFSYEEKALSYAITGGVAKYLSLLDDGLSLDENIISLFFKKTGYLFEEPLNLLIQEFRNINSYSDIISEIANGTTKLSELSDKTHIERSAISHAISNLIEIGIIEKETALTDENNKKKVLYKLKDGMFRFWYQFVLNASSAIELGKGDLYYKARVKPSLHNYMGSIFEDMCKTYTLNAGISGFLNCFITKTGRWWGSDAKTKEQIDLDVVGIDAFSKKAVLGECKFKNTPIDRNIYETLLKRSDLIDKNYEICQYLFFSLSGFSSWVKEQASEKVKLLTLEEMYNVKTVL